MKRMSFLQVVAVIGIAVAMLFPTLSQADTVNNLKDIGSAVVLPSEEFEGEIPHPPGSGVIMTNVTISVPVNTAQFTDSGIALPGIYRGSLAWGDYDNDGNLDLAVCGAATIMDSSGNVESITRIHKNNGDNTFTDIGAGLPGIFFGSLAWGDYDNDGNLDLVISGLGDSDEFITRIYENNGDNTFTDIGAGLTGTVMGSLAWGDYDNDGDLDLVISGLDDLSGESIITRVYRNNGDNTFTDIGAGLPGTFVGSVAWGDYDNDGDLDLAICGDNSTKIYNNDAPLFINALPGHIVAWGDRPDVPKDVPKGDDFIAIASGAWHNLAIKLDGSLVEWGIDFYGRCGVDVPEGNDFVAVDAGHYHSLALKSVGSLVAWGLRDEVPEGNDFIAISCGSYSNLALKSDGSLISWSVWGMNDEVVPEGNDFIAIAAGRGFNIALRSNGSLAAAGNNYFGQCDVPEGNDFVAITAGDSYAITLKSDGSIVAWGDNSHGQCDVPEGNDFVAITAGSSHSLALKSDGSLVAWGSNYYGQSNVPEGNDFVAIAAGMWHSIALRTNNLPIADAGEDQTVYAWIDGRAEVTLDGSGSYDEDEEELTYMWLSRGAAHGDIIIATGINPTIELPVGEHTIKLIVNDGIEDSEVDEVVITVVEAMKVSLQVHPRVINHNSQDDGEEIMTWMQMPEGITKDQIDENTLLEMYPGGIQAIRQGTIQYEGKKAKQIRIQAFFNRDELTAAVPGSGSVQLTVVGKLKTGQYFYGTDTVDIRNQLGGRGSSRNRR